MAPGPVCISFLCVGPPRDRHCYVVRFRPETAAQAPEILGNWTRNPELQFGVEHAAKLTKAVLEEACQGVR